MGYRSRRCVTLRAREAIGLASLRGFVPTAQEPERAESGHQDRSRQDRSGERHWGDIGKKSVPLTGETLKGYDCVLIATHHAAYDWQMVADHARLLVDTRNALKDVKGRRDHIVVA